MLHFFDQQPFLKKRLHFCWHPLKSSNIKLRVSEVYSLIITLRVIHIHVRFSRFNLKSHNIQRSHLRYLIAEHPFCLRMSWTPAPEWICLPVLVLYKGQYCQCLINLVIWLLRQWDNCSLFHSRLNTCRDYHMILLWMEKSDFESEPWWSCNTVMFNFRL